MNRNILFMLLMVTCFVNDKAQCSCCGGTSGFSGGGMSPGLSTLRKNSWMGEIFMEYRRFSGVSRNAASDQIGGKLSAMPLTSMDFAMVSVGYGINNKLSVIAQQPMFVINTSTLNSRNLGDLLTTLNYFFFQDSTFKVGFQAGIELPVGRRLLIDSSTAIIAGSGSYDPVFGVSVTRTFKNSNLRVNGFFKITTRGFDKTNFGNFSAQQLNYTWFPRQNEVAICTRDSVKKERSTWGLSALLSGEWSQSQLKDNSFVANTGSYVVFGGIGYTFAYNGLVIPVTITTPLYQQYYGEQNKTQVRLRIGLTKTFN